VTQVLVDPDDRAFRDPSKPIGAQMGEARAKELAASLGWTVKEDAGRGWRRVVPSPQPKRIIELDVIKSMIDLGYIVVACGGGGIPVLQDERGELQGLEAVIDKDLASSMLARDLQAELFVISTGVEKVAINFNRPNQKWLEQVSLPELRRYVAEGHFAKGSMAPKIDAVIDGGLASFPRLRGRLGLGARSSAKRLRLPPPPRAAQGRENCRARYLFAADGGAICLDAIRHTAPNIA
jgi:carbamate kinase